MDLPLFPLHAVLCPGIAIPLHIFEERYRALVRDCLDGGTPFGVVLIRAGHEVGDHEVALHDVGTMAEIREVGRYPDGRFDLLVVGTRRFAIERLLAGETPYLRAEVTVLEDEVGDSEVANRLAMRATRRFVHYLELLQPREGETSEEIDVRVEVETEAAEPPEEAEEEAEPVGVVGDPDPEPGDPADGSPGRAAGRKVLIPDDPTVLSYLLTGIIQVETPRRQALLEAETTEDRLRALLGLIDREVLLLNQRLRAFVPDRLLAGPRRS